MLKQEKFIMGAQMVNPNVFKPLIFNGSNEPQWGSIWCASQFRTSNNTQLSLSQKRGKSQYLKCTHIVLTSQ